MPPATDRRAPDPAREAATALDAELTLTLHRALHERHAARLPAHHDHAGGGAWFKERFHTPIIAGAADATLLAAGAAVDPLCPTDGIARGRLDDDQAARFTSLVADRWVETELPLAAVTGIPGTLTVLPGHTRGSVVVAAPGAAFVGDLFRGAIAGGSAEVHFYMCDLADNRADVRALLDRLAPTTPLFFPGHFGPVDRETRGFRGGVRLRRALVAVVNQAHGASRAAS